MPRRQNKNNQRRRHPIVARPKGGTLDFTQFNDRRAIKIAREIDFSSTAGLQVQTFDLSPNGGAGIGSEFMSSEFPRRLTAVEVMLDNRQLASQPRLVTFLLPGAASAYDTSKLTKLAQMQVGNPQMTRSTRRLRIGPEFKTGQINDLTSQVADTLMIGTYGYEGSVRIVLHYEMCGPPLDLFV